MTLQLFAHPFSSYCRKALIALHENATPFVFRMLDPEHPENDAEWSARWPLRKMPILVDGEKTIVEVSTIIEYLQIHHPGPVHLIPEDALEARMLDRIFDNYVMTPMQQVVGNALRPEDAKDPYGVGQSMQMLDKVYAWLEARLQGRKWAAGDAFTIADCAAAPSLFYADWVRPIPDGMSALKSYRARLLARPSVSRAVEEARPFRRFFPLGAPDRD
ncbi:glutathione S-transferase family protein [Sphingomonas soli]|uniref:glutathione S-transferase family protein n=1 Tax=Sphingomonas soli TaxID=266127 RepID=UPI00082FE690|nr:glutathione S-transferase family protein [Sphingomonas soli]